MKELTDSERLEVAMSLLDEHQVDDYADRCSELEHNCERNDFHDVPAECENRECNVCAYAKEKRRLLDCPYMDVI